ncbi:MAG: FAD-dependent oxidoreductase [Hyphomicrobiaceae bacterium]
MTSGADIVVIGAGIAGASVAGELASRGADVLLLEREEQPGYHSTGRSAAMFIETYGPEQMRRLTRAGRDWFMNPAPDLADGPYLSDCGSLFVGYEGDEDRIEALVAEAKLTGSEIQIWTPAQVVARVPIMRADRLIAAVHEPGAMAIDVDRVLQSWLRLIKREKGRIETRAEVVSLRRQDGRWQIGLKGRDPITARVVIDAAGAWADEVAALAGVARVGLQPKRRTGIMIDLPAGVSSAGWPIVGDVASTFYFKADGGRLMLSPADETPVAPQDIQPEEIDIAVAIDRFMTATTVEVRRPGRTWAGLRSFVADGEPVIGYEPEVPGFFWLAGQGGYGIQSSAGAARLAASLVGGGGVPPALATFGVSAQKVSPARFR